MRIRVPVTVIVLFLLVLLFWIPFGFQGGFTGDAWIFFQNTNEGNAMSYASATRLLGPIPWILAYQIAPDTFIGMNVLTLLLIFGKAWIVHAILRHLTDNAVLAFAAAVLSVVIPVDDGVFYLGALNIHFALFCYLLALYLLCLYWKRRRISLLLMTGITQALSVGVYELVYPLILFSPLILLYPAVRPSRRFWRTAALWYLVPGLYALWYGAISLAFPRAALYQTTLIDVERSLGDMIGAMWRLYRRHFVDAWLASPGTLPASAPVLALLAGVIVFALCFWLMRTSHEGRVAYGRLGLAGLAMIGLGIVLYLPTALSEQTVRIFYYSSVGAALVLAVILALLAQRMRRQRMIFAAALGVLSAVGCLRLFGQHQAYIDASEAVQARLTEFARFLPQVQSGSMVVVIDDATDFYEAVGSGFFFEYQLPALYGDYSLDAALCLPADVGTEEGSRCWFTPDGFLTLGNRRGFVGRPYSQLIVIRHSAQGFSVADKLPVAAADYSPHDLIVEPLSPPTRVDRLFGNAS